MHVSCSVVEMFLNVFLFLAVDQRDAQVLFVCKFLQGTSDLMFLPMLKFSSRPYHISHGRYINFYILDFLGYQIEETQSSYSHFSSGSISAFL
jgi:hypothetical protein